MDALKWKTGSLVINSKNQKSQVKSGGKSLRFFLLSKKWIYLNEVLTELFYPLNLFIFDSTFYAYFSYSFTMIPKKTSPFQRFFSFGECSAIW